MPTDGRGLPSIATPDSQRVRSETSRKTSKDLRGRSDAHLDISRSLQTLTPIRTSVGGKRGNWEGEGVKQSSVRHRTSHTLSVSVPVVDANWSRNWNSEGGRPKREGSPSERNCERLLRRSLNSVGELIPFQRAPRDGSYESQLPLGRRVGARRPAKSDLGDMYKESLSCEQRRAVRLQERPAESCEEQMSELVTDPPKDKRVHTASKSTLRRNKISVPKKENTREGNSKLTEVPTRSKSKELWKSDPSKTLALSKRNAVHTVDVSSTTDNACPRTLRQGEGKNTRTSQFVLDHESKKNLPTLERSDTADIQTACFSPRSSNESSICHPFAEEELTFSQRTGTASPSAEFKAAARLKSSTSAGSYSESSTLNANTPSSTTSSNTTQNQATESNESNTARQEQHLRSAGQPNSVIRRFNSSGSIDTSQVQSNRAPNGQRQSGMRRQNLFHDVPTSSEISLIERDCAPSDTDYSAAGSSSQPIASATDDPNLKKDPTHPSTGTNTNLQAPDTSTPQVRLNRFGRRIRLPSTDSVLRPEEQEQVGQDDVLASEPVGEERSQETNGQRNRFFAVSRNNRIQTDRETPSLTPNRDLLYGRYSPPALRRHSRARFGGIHAPSDHGHSWEENGSSAGDSNNHNSTFEDGELNLAPDSFRNASGSAVVFAPVLHSGPDSSSSPRLPIETNSPRELPSPISDLDESSSDNDLDQETLTFSVDEGRVSRDFMRRHQTDRSEAISRLLPHRSRQPSRRLSREVEIMEEVFESTHDQSSDQRDPLEAATMELQVPLLGSPLFAPLGVSPAMLLSLLIRTRREFGQEFMELLLENMMLNALAHHLFEGSSQDENGLSGAPPPATQDIIDNLKEIPALKTHIAQEMKCAICHSEYELYEMLAELPCLHFFHPTCVANWLKKSGTCPVCRFHLSSPTR